MVGPYDSLQEWIANVFYEPPKVGRHRSWCPPGSIEKSGMTGCIYETGEQCCLLADDSSAQRRELIVAAPSIVRSTRVCGLRLGDQLIGHQSGEGPQRARAEPNASGGELINKTHDGVPMAVAGRQRKQDVEAGGPQGRVCTSRAHM